jgi:hypothetical protein
MVEEKEVLEANQLSSKMMSKLSQKRPFMGHIKEL